MHLRSLVLAIPLACGGCAAMFHGTSQSISISTDPAGATCNVWRDGVPIAAVPATPGAFIVDKSKDTLTIVCDRPDFETAFVQLPAISDPAAIADVIIAPIALLFDAIAGSLHSYANSVIVPMVHNGRPTMRHTVIQHL